MMISEKEEQGKGLVPLPAIEVYYEHTEHFYCFITVGYERHRLYFGENAESDIPIGHRCHRSIIHCSA